MANQEQLELLKRGVKVRLDDAVMETTQQWAHDIRDDRHIGDFRKWKEHDAYQQSFARLLRDLQGKGEGGDVR